MKLALAVALAALAGPAQAQEMRPQETVRLEQFDAALGQALKRAMALGRRGDIDLVQEALEGPAIPALRTSLSGDWTCRTIKMGGDVPLVAYAPFQCRFTPDGDGFIFEKLTGSQLTRGRVDLRDGQMVYLGVGYVADVDPMDYTDLPEGDFDSGERQPEVALVEQSDGDRARLLFPLPTRESVFDILHLTR